MMPTPIRFSHKSRVTRKSAPTQSTRRHNRIELLVEEVAGDEVAEELYAHNSGEAAVDDVQRAFRDQQQFRAEHKHVRNDESCQAQPPGL